MKAKIKTVTNRLRIVTLDTLFKQISPSYTKVGLYPCYVRLQADRPLLVLRREFDSQIIVLIQLRSLFDTLGFCITGVDRLHIQLQ